MFDDVGGQFINLPWYQWEFQDPKMEVLYHIRRTQGLYVVGILIIFPVYPHEINIAMENPPIFMGEIHYFNGHFQ